jgi:SAM-dependent methyltransferase
MAPVMIPLFRERAVEFRGEKITLVYAPYNTTWVNERCVELAIARWFLKSVPSEDVLEVGNVLSHYFDDSHTIVDKYEPGSIQVDIVDFEPGRLYDLILSISTIEHIAFDETDELEVIPEDVERKIRAAIDKCLEMLAPGGIFVITVPIGYNPILDGMIADNLLGSTRTAWYKKFPQRSWSEVSKEEGMNCRYGSPYPYANCIMLAEWDRPD